MQKDTTRRQRGAGAETRAARVQRMSDFEAGNVFTLADEQVAAAVRRALGDNVGVPTGPAALLLLLNEFTYTEIVQDREQLLDAAQRTILPYLDGSDEMAKRAVIAAYEAIDSELQFA